MNSGAFGQRGVVLPGINNAGKGDELSVVGSRGCGGDGALRSVGEDVPAGEKQAGVEEGQDVLAGGYMAGGLGRGIELHTCIPSGAGC